MPITLTTDSDHIVSLAEVKAHLNMTSTTSDAELAMVVGAAEEQVQDIIGPVVWRTITAESGVVNTSAGLWLGTRPVVSITSLATLDDTPITVYTLDTRRGLLTDIAYRGPVRVTYVAGRTTVPDSVRLATLIIAEHLWASQRGTAPVNFDEVEGLVPTPSGFAIPYRAHDLLLPYSTGPAFA